MSYLGIIHCCTTAMATFIPTTTSRALLDSRVEEVSRLVEEEVSMNVYLRRNIFLILEVLGKFSS